MERDSYKDVNGWAVDDYELLFPVCIYFLKFSAPLTYEIN